MNRRALRWWLLAAVAYLVFLGMSLPAQYLADHIAKKMPQLELAGVTGSVFAGSAAEVRYQGTDLGAVDWHFDWLAPFSFNVGYRIEVHAEDRDLRGRLDLGVGSIHLRGLEGRIPVAAMDRWSPLPPNSVSGSLGVHLKELLFKSGKLISAEGELDLDEAVLKWPTTATLGSFRTDLTPASGGGIQAAIADVASPLKLDASLSLSDTGAYHLKGVLAAKDPGDQATRSLLSGLGQPDSTGRYPFDFNGQW
jgi:general secretion pathway protein N